MKKNIKTGVVIEAFVLLGKAEMSKCQAKEKFAVIRTKSRLKPIVEAYETTDQEAVKSLRPDNFDALVEMEKNIDTLSAEDRERVESAGLEYNRQITDFRREALEREVEVEVETLDEEALGRLLESNPSLTVSQCETLMTVFLAE